MNATRRDPVQGERNQRTIQQPATFSGIGIHTCQEVQLRFCPAPPGFGIQFQRTDLAEKPLLAATVDNVIDTSRSTTIGNKYCHVQTVEHLLSALKAYSIDNLLVEISNIEPPIGNGSADQFIEMIENAGIEEQNETTPLMRLDRPIFWSDGDIHLVALPSDEYRISYTLSYPTSPMLKTQYASFAITSEIFKKEIAPCRTFSLYKEISYLIDKGLIKGGSLANAVVVCDDAIISKGGLFFPDEMARHKILDLIGDLALIRYDIKMHVIAIKSGHATNVALAKEISNYFTR